MRRIGLIIGVLLFGWLAGLAHADTFKLTTGDTVAGDLLPTTANDQGVKIKVAEGEYQQISWGSFSQDDLKKLAQNPKLETFVEPYIEISAAERSKNTEFTIKQPPRLNRPAPHSVLGALFSSGLGLFLLLILYTANVYAGFEIARCRALRPALVCGVAAIAPLVGPVIFLSLPGKNAPHPAEDEETAAAASTMPTGAPPHASPASHAPAPTARAGTPAHGAPAPRAAAAMEAVNPMQADNVAAPSSLHLAHSETEHVAKPAPPKTVTFQRGQFTFNRRFFETKFPGFFGVVRKEADRDMVLVIKAARGEYIGQRISRISAGDLHLEVRRGPASEEILIPFPEIKEIQLKHKDA